MKLTRCAPALIVAQAPRVALIEAARAVAPAPPVPAAPPVIDEPAGARQWVQTLLGG